MLAITPQASAGDVLHQAMHGEGGRLGRAGHQGGRRELAEGVEGVPARLLLREIGLRHLQQRLRDRLGPQPGEPFEQPPGGAGEAIEGGLPGDGEAHRIVADQGIEPGEDLIAPRLPLGEVFGEGQPALGDGGAGLLQGEREIPQLPGELRGPVGVVRRGSPPARGARQQEGDGGVLGEKLQLDRLHLRTPAGEPAGQEHMAAVQAGNEGVHRRRGLFGVDVVEDQQPPRLLPEPAQDGRHPHVFFRNRLLRQVQHLRRAECREVAPQVGR